MAKRKPAPAPVPPPGPKAPPVRRRNHRPRKPAEKPSNREMIFVTHYLAGGCQNGFAAAVAAGYKEKAAYQAQKRLLRRPRVMAEIAARQATIVKKLEIKAEDVLAELAKVAFDPEVSAIKVRALELLGKHHQLWVERVDMRVDAMRPEERAARAAALLAVAKDRLLSVSTTPAEGDE